MKKSLSSLKKKAWSLLSQYKRLSAADSNGYAKCVTCGSRKHWKELQAGHFVPQAQGNAARFDENNVHVQCYRCNINLGGNGAEYSAFILSTYGEEEYNRLRGLAGVTRKINRAEYEEMIANLQARLESLSN